MMLAQRIQAALMPLPAAERAAQVGTLDGLKGRPKRAERAHHADYLRGYYAGVVARESRECDACGRRLYPAARFCPACLDLAWAMAS